MSARARRRWAGAGLRCSHRLYARAGRPVGLGLLGAVLALTTAGAPARAQSQPSALAPTVVAGPYAPGAGPTALTSSIARDGTGALVFLAPVGGVAHVFVSTLIGGTFQPPVRVDGPLAGPSSQPQVAAGAAGALVIAFINGSGLYVAQRRSAPGALSAPRVLAAGAGNPALAMSPYGKAYLAFTVPDGTGFDVRAAFDGGAGGGWGIERAPLNVSRGDDAGAGAGRPAVAAAGDGVGSVAWGEAGHVFTRRVWGTTPSTVAEQADAPLPGCREAGADEPAIGAGGDSSYAAVALHETLSCGGQTVSRVLVNRLHGSRFDGVWPADGGLGAAAQGADHPAVTVGEYGSGWLISAGVASTNLEAMALTQPEIPGPTVQVNTLPNASPPVAAPAMAGLFSAIVAWQHDPGAGGAPEIRARYADSDQVLGPEYVLSSPGAGPTNAAAGLTAGGDLAGDAAVAWVQSGAAGDELVADELLRAPGAPLPTPMPGYQRIAQPRLSWGAASEPWGVVRYAVTLDGAPLAQTTATSVTAAGPLAQGPHRWQLTATNQAGLASATVSGRFFVDTQPPAVTVTLGPNRLAGRGLSLRVSATDHPAPLPARDTSGVAAIVVRWGDGQVELIGHRGLHTYRRPGRYRLAVIVVDRAGNATTHIVVLHVRPKPKPHKKSKHAAGTHG